MFLLSDVELVFLLSDVELVFLISDVELPFLISDVELVFLLSDVELVFLLSDVELVFLFPSTLISFDDGLGTTAEAELLAFEGNRDSLAFLIPFPKDLAEFAILLADWIGCAMGFVVEAALFRA